MNETAGDGLMVIFHEGPHARAAVDAARAIHRRAAEIGAELAARFEPVAMHVGVNTGPALLGATKIEGSAGTRWTYTASGMTTNIAARLAAQAGDGEIVISEATRTRLGDGLAVEDLGVRELRTWRRRCGCSGCGSPRRACPRSEQRAAQDQTSATESRSPAPSRPPASPRTGRRARRVEAEALEQERQHRAGQRPEASRRRRARRPP